MPHHHDTDDDVRFVTPMAVVARLQTAFALAIPVVVASLLTASHLS